MTDSEKASEALDLVRRFDRRRTRWTTARNLYFAVVATAAVVVAVLSLTRLGDQQARITEQQKDQARILQIVKDATDPNSAIAQRGKDQVAQFGEQQAARIDAIIRQRNQELLDAIRGNRPIVFGPTPTLPPPPTTVVPGVPPPKA